jgi:hypothetical protein
LFWGLTWIFWAENAEKIMQVKTTAIESVASPSGKAIAFGPAFYGMRERLPFRCCGTGGRTPIRKGGRQGQQQIPLGMTTTKTKQKQVRVLPLRRPSGSDGMKRGVPSWYVLEAQIFIRRLEFQFEITIWEVLVNVHVSTGTNGTDNGKLYVIITFT